MYDVNGIPVDISNAPINPAAYTMTQDAQTTAVEPPPLQEPTTDTYTDGTISVRRGQY